MSRILSSLVLFLISSSAFAEELSASCARIVSISPSVTEVLFSIGLGKSVVGVSRYDTYPAEVHSRMSVGGLLDPNLETIASLRPGMVVGLTEQRDVLTKIQGLGIDTITLEHRSLAGVISSFGQIQEICHSDPHAANEAKKKALNSLEVLRDKSRTLPQRKVVVVVSREYDADTLKDVYLSGNDGYYTDVLGYVGAVNVFSSPTGSLSSASLEGMIALDPDVIIEVLPPNLKAEKGTEHLMKPWLEASMLRSVKNGDVVLLDEDWATIPGPRVAELAATLFSVIHRSHES